MKGIKKHKGRLYKRAKNKNLIKKGDTVELLCKRGSDYFMYNGIYEVIRDPYPIGNGRMSGPEIHIPKEVFPGISILCLKLGYNVGNDEWYKLVPFERKSIARVEEASDPWKDLSEEEISELRRSFISEQISFL